jgi:hypothetical protein
LFPNWSTNFFTLLDFWRNKVAFNIVLFCFVLAFLCIYTYN